MAIYRVLTMGSKGESGARLAEMMFSIFAMLRVNGIGEYAWLLDYLDHCAANGGTAPQDVGAWLRWQMDAQRLEQFSGTNVRP